MPLIHVHMMEGRPPERIQDMVRAVSHAAATSLGAPIETVRVVVHEMEPHQYGVGGKPWPQVVEERRKAQEAVEA